MSYHACERPWAGLLVRRGIERRSVVLLASALMLAAIFVAMRQLGDPAPGIGVLAVLPVTLVGLELGLAGGLAGAGLATALLAINAAGGHPELGVLGVATRAVAFVAVGGVAGRFSDRMRQAYAREERLLRSGLELGGGVADEHLATVVARAAARMPDVAGARVLIDDMEPGEAGRPHGFAASVPIAARGQAIGRIEVDGEPSGEERAALEVLASQAGLAADNRRLLARERERARIEADLGRARDELSEHRSGLGRLLSSQEDERSRIAHLLHEDLAQILSAVLMGLRVLDREAPDRRAAAVDDLRRRVTDVLRELREVAGALHPASLAQLGLRPALEALAVDGRLDPDLDGAGPLPKPLETAVYRIVQDALEACSGDGRLGVRVTTRDRTAELELRPAGPACARVILPAVRARAATVSGEASLLADGTIRVVAALPHAAAA